MRHVISTLILLACAAPVGAHPHVFIDTGLDLQFDAEGRLSTIRITWVYDEFYSLLVTEDMALDPDFDGALTPEEQNRLTGFDMRWIEGFNGDLVVLQDGEELSLSGPMTPTATLEDGKIVTTHLRKVAVAQDAGVPFEIKPYDPTYYTAYEVTLPVTTEGRAGCKHNLQEPEVNAALMTMRAQLNALDADTAPQDVGLPNIGDALATKVTVSCAAR